MAKYGRCLFKGTCELNCQVFVADPADSYVSPDVCVACEHHAAFHEQGQSSFVKASLLPPTSSSNQSVSGETDKTSSWVTGAFGKSKSFKEWKEGKTSSAFRKKSSLKKKIEPEHVTINIGLMTFDTRSMTLKPKWGKRLPLKTVSNATCSEILKNGLAKWKAFRKDYITEEQSYMLLFEDGSEARFLPGHTKEFFSLSRYKEELGRDYRRIILYLCSEEDFDYNHRCNILGLVAVSDSSSGEEEAATKSKKSKVDELESTAHELPSNSEAGASNATVPGLADRAETITTKTCNPRGTTCAYEGYDIPDEFLWGEFDDIDESELIRAATARSLEEQNNTAEEIELQELIAEFKKVTAKQEHCTIVILRKKLLQTCMKGIQDQNFDFTKEPCLVFSGEDCADLGGPRREFFRLLMQAVCKDLGVFEGSENNLVFSHNHLVIVNRKPFIAGQFTAWSILHGGPGPQCLAEDVFYLMLDLHDEVLASRAALIIADEGTAKLAKTLLEISTEEEYKEFKRVNSNCLLDQGISLHGAGEKDVLLMQVIKQALLYRVKPSIDLFLAGMDAVGQFFTKYVRRNPKAFLQLFIDIPAPLTVQQLKGLYVIKWSEEGSNKHDEEEDTIYCWEQFIKQVSEGAIQGCHLEDILVFVTGADKVPPLGFSRLISILFYDKEGCEKRRPWSSTCSLHLYLPRGVDDVGIFTELMVSSLKESCGFGKV